MKKIKIMEWNIHGMVGYGNYVVPVKLIIDEIIRINPDVFVLNELIKAVPSYAELEILIKELGYEVCTTHYCRGRNGILIAVKKSLGEIKKKKEFVNKFENPDYLILDVDIDGYIFSIVGARIVAFKEFKKRKVQFDFLMKQIETIKNDFIVLFDANNGNIQFEGNKKYQYKGKNGEKIQREDYNYQLIWRIVEDDFKWSLMTPDKGGAYTNGKYSIITRDDNTGKLYHTKEDHILSSIKEEMFENVNYDWSFVNKKNGYTERKENDYLSDLIGLPDHAILSAEVKIKL